MPIWLVNKPGRAVGKKWGREMAEGEKALTLWDLYESNRGYFGGIIIDERPDADDLLLLLDMDGANRRRYLETLPEEFVDGFDLSLLLQASKE